MAHHENELIQYQLKCEQLEKFNKQLETEKNRLLEAYAKYWGHYNEKQKIKYTGRLIKDINNITQVRIMKIITYTMMSVLYISGVNHKYNSFLYE